MKIVFMGTPEPAAVSLRRLIDAGFEVAAVYTQPDRPSGRGNKVVFSPVKTVALDCGLPVYQPLSLREADEIERFHAIGADVAVVVAYGRILPAEYLTAFKYGAINLHFSLLPKYRGAAPVNWAIVNGESETGVTTMYMDESLDTGPILMQRSFSIGDDNSVRLMSRSAEIGADLLIETLADIEHLRPVAQDDSLATFAPIMKKLDGLIDWGMPADNIVNRIRGFQPFPGSYSYHDGKKVNIWEAKVSANVAELSTAGEVAAIERDRLTIGCGGNTSIDVFELQIEGKRRMSASDIYNGRVFSIGDRLGTYEK